MKKILLGVLLLSSFKSYSQWYNSVPALKVPYIPIQRATPVDYEGAAARGMAEGEAMRKLAVKECATRSKNLYESLPNRAQSFPDGWYKVTATDGIDMCGERIVYVSSNRITRWFVDDIYERKVDVSSLIEQSSATAKIEGNFVSCYFLDNIVDPTARASEPKFGAVNFYTNYTKLKGAIQVYVEGLYMGKIDGFFASGTPECNQQYTVPVFKKPGVYSYIAKNEKYSWQGTITVTDGVCSPYLLPVK